MKEVPTAFDPEEDGRYIDGYLVGKASDALFRYKVGQRVYSIETGIPYVVARRYRHNSLLKYYLVGIDGVELFRISQSYLTDIKSYVWNPESETPAEAAGEQEAQRDGRE